jgi:hypothetical protein
MGGCQQQWLLVAATVLVVAHCSEARGCGQPLALGLTCTDPQCTRNNSNYCVRGWPSGFSCNTTADCYMGLVCNRTSRCIKEPPSEKNNILGLAMSAVAVFCFGSSFVPIKKYKKYAGDGVFCQFLMCFGRFMVGVIVMLTRSDSSLYLEAAAGGMIWCLGTSVSVIIVQTIGMGLGVAIWGVTSMLLGWAAGNWGFFGIDKEVPSNEAMAYAGLFFSMVTIFVFVFVEPNSGKPKEDPSTEIEAQERAAINLETTTKPKTILDAIGKRNARLLGVGLSLFAGVTYGVCMNPAQRLMEHFDSLSLERDTKYSPVGLDYVFSFNSGAISMSFVLLVFHQSLKALGIHPTEKYFAPPEHAKIILPAFANGMIGAVASAAWFVANQNLGFVVSFPIIAAGPGVVSTLWGMLFFKEIGGTRNVILLVVAFVSLIVSAVLTAKANNK